MTKSNSYSILLVDDEVRNLNTLRRTFRRNYNVLSAGSGEDALNMMEENDIAIIITDHTMPGMTGAEFLIKAMQKTPDAIRIILTGYNDEESLVAAVNEGYIYSYVAKPWEPEELKSVVRQGIAAYKNAHAGTPYDQVVSAE